MSRNKPPKKAVHNQPHAPRATHTHYALPTTHYSQKLTRTTRYIPTRHHSQHAYTHYAQHRHALLAVYPHALRPTYPRALLATYPHTPRATIPARTKRYPQRTTRNIPTYTTPNTPTYTTRNIPTRITRSCTRATGYRLTSSTIGAISCRTRLTSGIITLTSSIPVMGALRTADTGAGDTCCECGRCCVRVRNGAILGESQVSHSSQRGGQPL